MKSLLLSDQALHDMMDAIAYVARDRPAAAQRLNDLFWRTFDLLCEYPGMGHARSDVPDERYRFKRVRTFLVAYRIEEDKLRVVRVVHGARDLRGLTLE